MTKPRQKAALQILQMLFLSVSTESVKSGWDCALFCGACAPQSNFLSSAAGRNGWQIIWPNKPFG